jgi:hypothetical protein
MAKTFKVTSFSLEESSETETLLKEARMLAAKDGWTFSEFIRTAIAEYVKRHSPGNPQLDLGHWNMELPAPTTLIEARIPLKPVCRHPNFDLVKIQVKKSKRDPAWFPTERWARKCQDCGSIS